MQDPAARDDKVRPPAVTFKFNYRSLLLPVRVTDLGRRRVVLPTRGGAGAGGAARRAGRRATACEGRNAATRG